MQYWKQMRGHTDNHQKIRYTNNKGYIAKSWKDHIVNHEQVVVVN